MPQREDVHVLAPNWEATSKKWWYALWLMNNSPDVFRVAEFLIRPPMGRINTHPGGYLPPCYNQPETRIIIRLKGINNRAYAWVLICCKSERILLSLGQLASFSCLPSPRRPSLWPLNEKLCIALNQTLSPGEIDSREKERDHDQVDLIWPPPSSLQRIIKWFWFALTDWRLNQTDSAWF